jgi:hypothetical protein
MSKLSRGVVLLLDLGNRVGIPAGIDSGTLNGRWSVDYGAVPCKIEIEIYLELAGPQYLFDLL